MLKKAIKPGQLFMANKKVFRCCKQTAKEYKNESVCDTCKRENRQECLALENNFDCCYLKEGYLKGGYPKQLV